MTDNNNSEKIGSISAILSRLEKKVDKIEERTSEFMHQSIITDTKVDATSIRLNKSESYNEKIDTRVGNIEDNMNKHKGVFSTIHIIGLFFIAITPVIIHLMTAS